MSSTSSHLVASFTQDGISVGPRCLIGWANGPNVYRVREVFIDNLLVQIHLTIEMIVVDRPCTMEV